MVDTEICRERENNLREGESLEERRVGGDWSLPFQGEILFKREGEGEQVRESCWVIIFIYYLRSRD